MKTTIISMAIAMTIASCAEKGGERYTQTSDEINSMKQSIKDYEQSNWDALKSHFADSALVYENTLTGIGPDEYVGNHVKTSQLYAIRDFPDANEEYEMVVTDEGETWVNFWGRFNGTLKANGKAYVIPVHITARFSGGKITEQHIYYDISPVAVVLDNLERMDAEAAMADSASAMN
jgi:hypothetical protein